MLDILEFIFQNPWHYIGFIILWWAIISPFKLDFYNDDSDDEEEEEDKKDA